MTTDELINALERMESETGSLADSLCCLGCGHEHNCGVYGCAVIREAIKTAQLYQAAYKVLERQRDCDTCLYNNPCGMDDLRQKRTTDDGRIWCDRNLTDLGQ